MRLEGKNLLITGGASGIGRAVVTLFVGQGACATVLDLRQASFDDAEFGGRKPGDRLNVVRADVTREAEVMAAVAAGLDRFGKLDGVVNAAGADLTAPLEETGEAEWNRMMAVNLNGPYLVCRAILPALRRAGGGTIVNISSAAALKPLRHRTAYCAAKAGLVTFGKALAIEAAEDGIRVNTICPGVVDTPMLRSSYEGLPDGDARLAELRSRNVLGRIADPAEIANAALFLSSDESSFVTGSVLAVDGGRSFH